MEAVDIQAVESKLSDVTVTAIPMHLPQTPKNNNLSATSVSTTLFALSNKTTAATANANGVADISLSAPTTVVVPTNGASKDNVSKYVQLLLAIEEMGREVRPTYAGSRSSAERLKRGIIQARVLVRECLLETERSARQ